MKKVAFYHPIVGKEPVYDFYGKVWNHWPLHYFVFAFDSGSIISVAQNLRDLQDKLNLSKRIDSIFVLQKGIVVNNLPTDELFALPTPGSKLGVIESEKLKKGNSLLTFFSLISTVLNQATMDRDSLDLKPYLLYEALKNTEPI